MVILVTLLDIIEDVNGLLYGGGVNQHLLESAFQCAVLFNMLTVLIECCCADALDLSAGQGRLEHVGGIKRAAGAAGAYDGVDLVNEKDDIVILCQLIEYGLHPLLELSAVLGAGNN